MLSEKFTTIGIAGYVADDGKVYWVQEFGYELSAQSGDSAPGSQTVAKPKATKITKLTAKKKGFVVQWKKGASGVKGYQIQYSLKSSFKNSKTVTVKGVKTTKKAVSKLKAKKKYYVRVRTYKVVNGKKVTSNWSAKKAIKTKG
ncbi:MAG: fibronectin type III domain-containing protein [Eubacterium sp.]|nr:fibronectin type III domain-containing protein [Eubacterium sp.]